MRVIILCEGTSTQVWWKWKILKWEGMITLNRLYPIIEMFPFQVEICVFNLLPRSFWSTQKSLISRSVWWQWWFLKVILLRLNSADQRWALAQHLLAAPTLLLSKIHLFKLDSWRCDIEHFWMMTCGGQGIFLLLGSLSSWKRFIRYES